MDVYSPLKALPRVLFVMGVNGTGGTELQARALITGLRERGVKTTVLLLDGSQGLNGLPSDTEILASERPSLFASLWIYSGIVRQVRRRLRSGEFDVIHGAHARGYMVVAAAGVGLKGIRRIAWRRNLGVHLGGPSRAVTKLLERAALHATDVVLANSDDVRDFWITRYGLASDKVLVVPNLLHDWRFDVERAPVSEPMRIVAVGGLRQVKGHEFLLRAVCKLNRKDIEVVIVGEGERRSSLEAQATNLNVKVLMPGIQMDTRPWLATATLFVHPSLSEGSSNAVLEAMAAGVPVVASDVGGMRELLGETGVIVPPGDEERLRDAISWLLDGPVDRQRMGEAARLRAREHFSEDAVIATTISVYRGELPCAES
jgi:glycosyltransferase involved in cell wall biosynthesis